MDSIKRMKYWAKIAPELNAKYPVEATENDCESGRITIGELEILVYDSKMKAITWYLG
jgi:hypothetical protein